MRRYVVILMIWSLILFIMVSCSPVKQVPVHHYQKDTIKITEVLRDTVVVVKTEKEYIEKTTNDTTSVLNTKYATSRASVKNNQLHHSLEQKKVDIPTKIVYKDKIKEVVKYEEKEKVVEVIVEKKYIPQWCWWVICYAVLMAGLTIMKIVYKIKGR